MEKLTTKKILLTAAVTGLLITPAYAKKAKTKVPDSKMGKCLGVNGCKGKGDCAGKVDGCDGPDGCSVKNSCKGHNSCKGKGIKRMTKQKCKEKGGKFEV